jgi:hypothetical protein
MLQSFARMSPGEVERVLCKLPKFTPELARSFAEGIGALPAEALPFLSKALPLDALRSLGAAAA